MMTEFDKVSLKITESKLTNLLHQVDSTLMEEFPNNDVRAAALEVRRNIKKLLEKVKEVPNLSTNTTEQILIRCTDKLSINSYLLGIILRSNATRNPFELYFPFREIAAKFFGENSVKLILSSEWDYVPITFPMTLEELPNFIVIGMPAPEADNVLTFPAAGHELGHSIWQRHELRNYFSPIANNAIKKSIKSEPTFLKNLFPHFTKKQFADDLFASNLQDMTIIEIQNSVLSQLEELFCDFVAVNIFGKSYLHAFRYLLAPGGSKERSKSYPDLHERAQIISGYAAINNFGCTKLERWFSSEGEILLPFESATTRLADDIRRKLSDELTKKVDNIFSNVQFNRPNQNNIDIAKISFDSNIPIESGMSLGELICGAWESYIEKSNSNEIQINMLGASISNLVLKSAEAMEFKARMTHVSKI